MMCLSFLLQTAFGKRLEMLGFRQLASFWFMEMVFYVLESYRLT